MTVTQLGQDELNELNEIITRARNSGGDLRSEYYGRLSDWGYDYGDLALGVANSSSFSGRVANAFLASTAAQNGNVINFSTEREIGFDLMEADLLARMNELRDQGYADELDAPR